MILDFLRPTEKSAAPGTLNLQSTAGWRLDGSPPGESEALKISTVSACMEIIANSIGMLPTFIMNEDSKQHLDDHYLGPVLWQRPNEMMTPETFKKTVVNSVLAHGNAYVWNYRDGAGHVIERIPVPAALCAPCFDMATGRWYYVATDPKTGQLFRLDPADLSHYKGFTEDGIHGIGVLERAARTLSTAKNMELYSDSVYANGGRPSGVLTVDTDLGNAKTTITRADGSKEEISAKERIRREWDGMYSGPGRAFRTAILDLGLKYTPIAPSNSDAQFVQQKEISVEDICRFFCVPPYKVGVGKQSYASNEQNNIEFAVQTLQPLITEMEQEDSWKLLTLTESQKKHYRIKQNMSALLRGDAKTRAEVENLYRTMGAYSVNDILALEDLPPVPGGDTRYASLNFIPLEFFQQLSLARNQQKEPER